jgi:hypothetical protein
MPFNNIHWLIKRSFSFLPIEASVPSVRSVVETSLRLTGWDAQRIRSFISRAFRAINAVGSFQPANNSRWSMNRCCVKAITMNSMDQRRQATVNIGEVWWIQSKFQRLDLPQTATIVTVSIKTNQNASALPSPKSSFKYYRPTSK